jgi:hypothetical protein
VRYITDLCKGWIGLISSSASVLFLILGLFRNLTLGFHRRYWLCASFGCFELFLVNKHPANNSRKKEILSVRGTRGKLYADPFFLHGYWVKSEYSDPNDLHARKRPSLQQGATEEGYLCYALNKVPTENIIGRKGKLEITDVYNVTQTFRFTIPPASENEIRRKIPDAAFRTNLL